MRGIIFTLMFVVIALCVQTAQVVLMADDEHSLDVLIKRSRSIQVELSAGIDLKKVDSAKVVLGQMKGFFFGSEADSVSARGESRALIVAMVSSPHKAKSPSDPDIWMGVQSVILGLGLSDIWGGMAEKREVADFTKEAEQLYIPIARWILARRSEVIPGYLEKPVPVPILPKNIDKTREPITSTDFLDPSLIIDEGERKVYSQQIVAYRAYVEEKTRQKYLIRGVQMGEQSLTEAILGSKCKAITNEEFIRKMLTLTGASKDRVDELWALSAKTER